MARAIWRSSLSVMIVAVIFMAPGSGAALDNGSDGEAQQKTIRATNASHFRRRADAGRVDDDGGAV
jgi:hypothetical protein